jgi:hypothetical protein
MVRPIIAAARFGMPASFKADWLCLSGDAREELEVRAGAKE